MIPEDTLSTHFSAWHLIIAIACVLLNAFFTAIEFAMVKIRATRLETMQAEGGISAGSAYKIVQHLNDYLSATQLGITLASLGLGWVGEPAFAGLLRPIFNLFHWSPSTVHAVSFALAFSLITTLHLVLGELVPKQLAIQSAEKVLLLCAVPLRMFYWVFYPFLRLLNFLTNLSIKILGIKWSSEDIAHNEEEIRLILEDSQEGGAISERKASLIENVFEFSDRMARFIMRHRQGIVSLELRRPLEENLSIAKESEHTRFPLCDGGLDHVIGLINIKDIVWQFENKELINLFDLKRPILMVPEGKPIDQLLRDFQSKKIHMAMVVDEFGVSTGLITLEDVMEELVGEIQDEFDQEVPKVIKNSERSFIIDGTATIREVEQALELELSDQNNVSIAGYFIDRLGRLAREGDSIDVSPYHVKAIEVKGRRIIKLLFERVEKEVKEKEEE